MRSKICKAKRKDNKEWVEGYYFCMVHDDKRHEHHFIIPIGADLSKGTPIEQIQVEIDIDTLCDDTGLTDKNGRKIWENDICKYFNQEDKDGISIIKCDYVSWVSGTISEKETLTPLFYLQCGEEWEVIGNIFDNPELLEKAR